MGILKTLFGRPTKGAKSNETTDAKWYFYDDGIILAFYEDIPEKVFVLLQDENAPGAVIDVVQEYMMTELAKPEQIIEFVPLFKTPFGDYQNWLKENSLLMQDKNAALTMFGTYVVYATENDTSGLMDKYWDEAGFGKEILLTSYLATRPREGCKTHSFLLSPKTRNKLAETLRTAYQPDVDVGPHIMDINTFSSKFSDVTRIHYTSIYEKNNYRLGRLDQQQFNDDVSREVYAISVAMPYSLPRSTTVEKIGKELGECVNHKLDDAQTREIEETFEIPGLRAISKSLVPHILVRMMLAKHGPPQDA